MNKEKIQFNPEQKKAITYGNGPVLIIAGAGTGKTMVITQRISHLILDKDVNTDAILALTFTDKAAEEMEERVDKLLPYGYVDLWISTFHSFCQKILEQHALDIGLPNDFSLLNQTSSWLLVRNNLDKFNLDYYKPLGNPTKFIHALLKHFSRAKDEEIYPDDYLEYAQNLKQNNDTSMSDDLLDEEALRVTEIAEAYHVYQKLLIDNNSLDFGDLINYTLKLLRKRPKILKKLQDQFEYVLLDEFQDTNIAQYELVKLLAGEKKNLTVVGDDDQCLPGNSLISVPNGKKKIKDFKVGDEILTGIGRSQIGISSVSNVIKNKKKVRYLDIKTKSGKKIRVTDNHKMFVHVSDCKIERFYVYLMHRQGIGYRIGITRSLKTRLRLERSSDSILAIASFETEKEARYYETFLSLKYGMPTSCFQQRKGLVIDNEYLSKLYSELDVDNAVRKLSEDLNKDLRFNHFNLSSVFRGNKSRVNVNLEICSRRYKIKKLTKYSKNYAVSHLLSLETSDLKIVNKLKTSGYELKKSKKGWRFRLQSADLNKLIELSEKLQLITNGIRQEKFKIGTLNKQSLEAIVMPAKNLVAGLFVPVEKGNKIYYDEIVELKELKMIDTVYDLEVKKTHNFIADEVVVHNSIYKFRGASVSNILQFKKDFPESQEIVLTQNYRSKQGILDVSYNFIQLNNPNRLEYQLNNSKKSKSIKLESKIDKRLKSNNKGKAIVEHIHEKTLDEEVKAILHKIVELKNKDKNVTWDDFAILVRANDSANSFISYLRQSNIPYQFLALRGLYNKPIILDILAYFKLLDNYHESTAVFRILSSPIVEISQQDIIKINHYAYKKTQSLYEVLKEVRAVKGVTAKSISEINRLLGMIEKHTQLIKEKTIGEIFKAFLEDTDYLEKLVRRDEYESNQAISYLNQFYKKIKEFEEEQADPKLKLFMEKMDLELEAGEEGSLSLDLDIGPEMIKIMTIHAAKGLEFKYVFIPNMVDRRFPTGERKDPIELPAKLIKEIIPEGDIHLEEERRLFYVAMTRAKDGLFLTSAADYGGVRKKKLSRFLEELMQTNKEFKLDKRAGVENKDLIEITAETKEIKKKDKYELPSRFSYSQLAGFSKCPYQYKLSYIMRVPIFGKAVFSYGKTMHATLEEFFKLVVGKQQSKQTDLFTKNSKKTGKQKIGNLVSFDELMGLFESVWLDEWYEDKEQKEKYYTQAKKTLKIFYSQIKDQVNQTEDTEKPFNLKIDNYTLRGVIDRIDRTEKGELVIVDYKTGKPKEQGKLGPEDKMQLLIYQIAAEEVLQEKVDKLIYYYLDNNSSVEFIGQEKDKEKVKNNISNLIKKINQSDFVATPNHFICKFCDFSKICEFKV